MHTYLYTVTNIQTEKNSFKRKNTLSGKYPHRHEILIKKKNTHLKKCIVILREFCA